MKPADHRYALALALLYFQSLRDVGGGATEVLWRRELGRLGMMGRCRIRQWLNVRRMGESPRGIRRVRVFALEEENNHDAFAFRDMFEEVTRCRCRL
ncbi:hypothetical protein GIB67_012518 [Kingdonia uniflora]|uniref:Uncharacterized protein n=1 Tax=Kingdonia uniflora TaxID=39325 RepID=A0A7J7LSN5_9MAGN|nr:hypothetical protein GIB67_012518 [Kingdonia uniflora]